ncbi:alpha/beta fold hydrolase [Thiocapsa rosea]|uniref:Pimeloyl-ACP methyl ester carboxylesterase n=1 Tax=Thiocapsa rosea TaxID=69360 RepID=A0A495V4F0_9GAMM|nr:alpha/beta hydrolase [Thiocapsa rosea]RKT44189.1 pimeloyl-ACP methyl ester carboxylesterase [Thiocapsa rosea]
MDFSTRHRLTLADGPVVYRQVTTGKPPLLLIHGWGGSSRHWQHTAEHLSDIRDLYALDLPGHGDTPARPGATGPETLADLVIDFADRLGLDRFDLNGHSWGAGVAILVAARRPERVDRLMLTSLGIARNALERLALTQTYHQMNLALSLWRPWLAMSRPWIALSRPAIDWFGAQPLVYRAIAAHVLRQLPADEETVRVGVREFLSTDPLSALECAIGAGSPAFLTALETMATPTLLVHADADPVMPPSGAHALAARIRNVREVCLDDCGHLPMIEQPEAYHRAIREFLTTTALDPRSSTHPDAR